MSENPNPETPNTETPATKPKDPDGYAVAFRTMQADMSRLALALALGVAVDLGAELGQLLPLLGELAVAGLHLALEVRRRRACGAEADAPAQAKGRVRG